MTDQTRLDEIRARLEGAKMSEGGPYSFIMRTDDVPFLLNLVDSLTKERDAHKVSSEQFYADFCEMTQLAADRKADLAALRAVVEEAREELDLIYDSGAMQVGANVKMIEILDRGLKGAE